MPATIRRPAVLFDLDGTLTDPFVGITRSLQYALEKVGCLAPVADDLRWCIGPPIHVNFERLMATTDRAAIDAAVGHYRDRYAAVGKFENTLIDGIPEVLAGLVADGYFLSVATSKLKSAAEDIVDHFALRPYFEVVHGSELDGRNSAKADLIAHILATEPIEAGRAVMIGDRSHDVVGATAHGIAAVGVLWGYGDRQELQDAGAAKIIADPSELRQSIDALLS